MASTTIKCKVCGADVMQGTRNCPYCGAAIRGFHKLTVCRTCGKSVAKNATMCPHCGAKRRQGTQAACWTIAILAISIWVCYIFIGKPILRGEGQSPTGQSTVATVSGESLAATPTPAISISAEDLWSAYSANKVNADNLYKDKLLAVTGTIIDIGQDMFTKAPCVSLDTGGTLSLYPIQCFFPKMGGQNDLIAALSDGDSITIYGTCNGTPVMQVQLSECFLQD